MEGKKIYRNNHGRKNAMLVQNSKNFYIRKLLEQQSICLGQICLLYIITTIKCPKNGKHSIYQ